MAPPGFPLRPGLVAAALCAALAIGGCGGSDETTTSSTSTTTEPASTTTTTATQPVKTKPEPVDLYFTAGEQFQRVALAVPGKGSTLERATQALLAGPQPGQAKADVALRSQIPDGVRLVRVSRSGEGKVLVEVSDRFLAGIPAAAGERSRAQQAELDARVGQLTYTLTQLPGVDSVEILSGGRPAEAAADRADYAKPSKGPNVPSRPRGEKSPSTRDLQKRLAHLRFLPRNAVDGVAGYQTQQAVIAFQAWNGLERDGIIGPATTAALARAHRPKPSRKGPSRRIEVYRDKGVALLIEHDRVKRAIHVSAGAPGTPTPAGTFEVFRKELRSWSVPFQVWLPLASYFNHGIAFHEYPDVPPFPASHGCVRVPSPEAKGVYEFASIGTTVLVL